VAHTVFVQAAARPAGVVAAMGYSAADYIRRIQERLNAAAGLNQQQPAGFNPQPAAFNPANGMPARSSANAKWWDICKLNLDNFELFLKGTHGLSAGEISAVNSAIARQANTGDVGPAYAGYNVHIHGARMTFPSASPHNGPWPPSLKPKFHAKIGDLMDNGLVPNVFQCQHCR